MQCFAVHVGLSIHFYRKPHDAFQPSAEQSACRSLFKREKQKQQKQSLHGATITNCTYADYI